MENKSNNWLADFKENVHSQAGEDGVLSKIFQIIKDGDRQCVEFGAWDGEHLSNVYNLVKNKGWGGVLIESDAKKYNDLVKSFNGNGKVLCLNKLVGFEGGDVLDVILQKTKLNKNFDLLSIDIDGNDYHIWDSLKLYGPKVVVIEFNPSIPGDIVFIQKRDMRINQGSSLLALTNLAKEKGYELIAVTDLNAFFVKKEYFALFEIVNNSPKELFKNTKYQTRIFQLYDGTIMIDGCDRLIWHNMKMDFQRINPIPRFFRNLTATMNPYQLFLFRAWRVAFNLFRRK